ncbi:hypothetical protein JXK06_00870, partial [Patescibacteria group bacterium]|nr:hypothetical protein [Patescibacteria group bacterium]
IYGKLGGLRVDTNDVSEAFNISANGNVGIGVSNPGAKLDVFKSGENQLLAKFQYGSYKNSIEISSDSVYGATGVIGATIRGPWFNSGGSSYGYQTDLIRWRDTWLKIGIDRDDNSGRTPNVSLSDDNFVIRSTGNVGIGTTNPDSILEILQTVPNGEGASLRIINNGAAMGSGQIASLVIGRSFEERNWKIRSESTTNYGEQPDLIFTTNQVAGGSSAHTEVLRIKNGGNVGIGTTSPSTKLTVNGGTAETIDVAGGHIFNLNDTPLGPSYAVPLGYLEDNFIATSTLSASSFWSGSLTGNIFSANTGNVGIGTSTPGLDKLRVVGPVGIFGSLNLNNNNITGINKLTVNTIDPLYNIKGTNYSTFASAIVGGVKEEYVGRIEINRKRSFGDYETVIDFNKQKEGSDLWVWRQTVDFSEDNVEVFISALGDFARTYFLIEDEKIILRSDRPIKASYRLVGRRLDWKEWPTKALDQEEKAGFIID